ncbi:MAG: DUF3341 domain-containing protein [Lentisphaeria bacterium]|nr:DUF3341 domain-containing protein [Lentisphaeria bacterium]
MSSINDTVEEINSKIDDVKFDLEVMGVGPEDQPGQVVGVLAEFESPAALMKAAAKVRDGGYKFYDCHSPFPIHGMDQAMGLKPSVLGIFVFIAGTIGCIGGMALQWWANAYQYKMMISGKPLFSFPAFVPVTFEITILFSALTAVFGMFHLNRLPRLHHPVFYSENFKGASDDKFFVSIEAIDNLFDANRTWELLERIGGKNIEFLVAKK